MAKIGSEFAKDMLDRGRRELGGVLYADSNIAQPMYPLRGGYEPSKEAESSEDRGSILESRLREAQGREEPERDDKSMDRE